MRAVRIGDFEVSDKDRLAINEVLESGRITEHSKTKEFEKRWAEIIGTKYCVAVNSGTSALIAGLYAIKHLAEEGRNKIITTPVTYVATSNAIKLAGFEPVYADVDRETFSLLPSGVEKILAEHNPQEFIAILPVHLMGFPCDMDEINTLARKYDLFSFEDAAQAHGSTYNGKVCGSLGDLADFSFYVAHNIQAGELGAINTDNKEIKNLVKKIKAHGRACVCDVCKRMEGQCPQLKAYTGEEDFEPRFTHDIFGFNLKTSEFNTALALNKLDEMDEINNVRRDNVRYLNEGLKKHSDILQLPKHSEEISYLGYPLVLKQGGRKQVREGLEKKGIETRTLFGCIPTQQPSFSYLKEEYNGRLPNAEYVGGNGFYIGCHQFLNKEDLDHIIKSFDEVLK